jgi:hypothetical protein
MKPEIDEKVVNKSAGSVQFYATTITSHSHPWLARYIDFVLLLMMAGLERQLEPTKNVSTKLATLL